MYVVLYIYIYIYTLHIISHIHIHMWAKVVGGFHGRDFLSSASAYDPHEGRRPPM